MRLSSREREKPRMAKAEMVESEKNRRRCFHDIRTENAIVKAPIESLLRYVLVLLEEEHVGTRCRQSSLGSLRM